MRKIYIGILAVVAVSVSPGSRIVAQQPTCLHGTSESPGQQLRKRQALAMARQINSAEVVATSQAGSYQPLDRLSRVTMMAEGFILHLAVDATGYAFSIKDSTDPCGFAFFSDQNGIIYRGEALR